MRRLTIKDHLRETRLFNNRVIAALVIVVLLMGLIVWRLVQLQVVEHEHLTTLSKNNRVRIVPISPTRGLIYDRNGEVLAENKPSFSLEIVPERVRDMDATLEALGSLIEITEVDLERFRAELKKKRRFESVPLRFRLGAEEVARIAVNRHRFDGVDIQARLTRHYPLGALGVHAVGYVGRIDEQELSRLDASNYAATTHIGKLGVEKSYEDRLHGKVGYQQVETNAQGRVLRILSRTPPVPGRNIRLGLDANLQRFAEEALGEERGAVVVIDVATGDVLALGSTPVYDGNLFVNGIAPATYRALQQSQDKPLFNRALLGRYPPGSTIKPLVGLAGLEYGVIGNEGKTYCPGWYQLPGKQHKYRDWKRTGHGAMNLDQAITQSCDVYFYDLARKLGIDRMHDFLGRFSLGRKTGIDIPGESAGLMPSTKWKRRARRLPWYPGETLITGIGQGFTLTTPLQLAHATAILANRGTNIRPRLVAAQQAAGAEDVIPLLPKQGEPVTLGRPERWDTVIEAMVNVVHGQRGTARRIGLDAPYTIAGKTGTAQVFGIKQEEKYEAEKLDKRLHDHSLFVAFAPADAPQVAIAVVVENAGSGSKVAAPIARRVLDHYFGVSSDDVDGDSAAQQ